MAKRHSVTSAVKHSITFSSKPIGKSLLSQKYINKSVLTKRVFLMFLFSKMLTGAVVVSHKLEELLLYVGKKVQPIVYYQLEISTVNQLSLWVLTAVVTWFSF